jgi:hypothetical protein
LTNLQELLQSELARAAQLMSAASEGIRQHIRDQSPLVDEKTRDFVGRRFAFEAIQQFVEEMDSGYLIIRGDPGIGKSALVAQLVKIHGYVHHFNVRAEGVNTAALFLQNICAQLIARYRLNVASIPPEAAQDSGFLTQLLVMISRQLQAEQRLVVVVDALDEVDREAQRDGTNILMLPRNLPAKVYVVATSRKETTSLQTTCAIRILDIEQDNEGNTSDIREYLQHAVDRPGVQTYIAAQHLDASRFVESLTEKCQGNFMYLHYVLPEIARGRYQTREFDQLPVGLMAYYEDHWRAMKGKDEADWFAYRLPVLMALTVVKEAVSLELISAFCGVSERPKIRSVLQDWREFLSEENVEVSGEWQKRYRMYHASFHDFIASKEQVQDERVNRMQAHKRIADRIWNDLGGADGVAK